MPKKETKKNLRKEQDVRIVSLHSLVVGDLFTTKTCHNCEKMNRNHNCHGELFMVIDLSEIGYENCCTIPVVNVCTGVVTHFDVNLPVIEDKTKRN